MDNGSFEDNGYSEKDNGYSENNIGYPEKEENPVQPGAVTEKPVKKTRFWRGFFTGILATLILMMLFLGGVFIYLTHQVSGMSSGTGEARRSLDYDAISGKLSALKRLVDRYFLFDVNVDDMETGIYRGMIYALDDPYTVYYTPEEYQQLTEETDGTYSGIGALVSQNLETGMVTILRVFADSPAEKAGIQKGDILYKVNGIEASTQDLDLLVSEEVRGEDGTTVSITVLRDGEEMEFEVVRGPVEEETVDYQLLDDGRTGYIIVAQFDTVTAGQFVTAVDELERLGMTQLVIDLRDNPGGVLDTAVLMAAYLLPDDKYDGTLISIADKDGRGARYYSADGEIYYDAGEGSSERYGYPKEDGHEVDIPIAILINGESASAAELFSGALHDYGAATLVGTTTYGKGIVQSVFPLSDGSAVKITTDRYYTPSGYDLHGVGIEPDLEVEYEIPEDPLAAAQDPLAYDNQLAAAIELLNEESGHSDE